MYGISFLLLQNFQKTTDFIVLRLTGTQSFRLSAYQYRAFAFSEKPMESPILSPDQTYKLGVSYFKVNKINICICVY